MHSASGEWARHKCRKQLSVQGCGNELDQEAPPERRRARRAVAAAAAEPRDLRAGPRGPRQVEPRRLAVGGERPHPRAPRRHAALPRRHGRRAGARHHHARVGHHDPAPARRPAAAGLGDRGQGRPGLRDHARRLARPHRLQPRRLRGDAPERRRGHRRRRRRGRARADALRVAGRVRGAAGTDPGAQQARPPRRGDGGLAHGGLFAAAARARERERGAPRGPPVARLRRRLRRQGRLRGGEGQRRLRVRARRLGLHGAPGGQGAVAPLPREDDAEGARHGVVRGLRA
mmetsp:Transcript_21643/g.70619  ORF Transcript_21643/g.70619 Transcript_21643/m.70619 type:complete len:288 (-) Transcript_21643:376-1239(-)